MKFIKKHLSTLERKIIAFSLVIIAMVIIFYKVGNNLKYYFVKPITIQRLDELKLEGYDNLMIVAHPDDEMLWGGAHLLSDKYLVVVITNGDNKTRAPEFKKVTEQAGCKGLILSYPDKMYGKRSDWSFCMTKIENDVKTIMNYKNWKSIVTHNENGEYGHQHHKYTHKIVLDTYLNENKTMPLYFFGKFYKENNIPKDLKKINSNLFKKKEDIEKIYVSQKKVINGFKLMNQYENWTVYEK